MQRDWLFSPFELSIAKHELLRQGEPVALRPKVWSLLVLLIEQRERVVPKAELLEVLWPDTTITEQGLTEAVRELRHALGDDARRPRYLRTVRGVGYQFIAEVSSSPETRPPGEATSSGRETVGARRPLSNGGLPLLVGRDDELATLAYALTSARARERQLVFVVGEAGIGKTVLTESFLRSAELARSAARVALGRCVEGYGYGDAYLPVFDALARLVHAEPATADRIERCAPSWWSQMPGLHPPERTGDDRSRATPGETHSENMLRELVELLEALSRSRSLVLVLEDLHWADPTTLRALGAIACRSEPARLLIVATFRTPEMAIGPPRLRNLFRELESHAASRTIELTALDRTQTGLFVRSRLDRVRDTRRGPGTAEPTSKAQTVGEARARRDEHESIDQTLADELFRRTEGNPLFLERTVDHAIEAGWIRLEGERPHVELPVEGLSAAVPDSLRGLTEKQLERLQASEQRLLEAASVAGLEFSAAAAAVAVKRDEGAVEDSLDRLARRAQFLRPAGMTRWPDGTVSSRYAFTHALHQAVCRERVPAGRFSRIHRLVGLRKEAAYGRRAIEIAAELALHFEQGGDVERALHYRKAAARKALRSAAQLEAIDHFESGLRLLPAPARMPLEQLNQAAQLQDGLGQALMRVHGYGAPAVEQSITRMQEICDRLPGGRRSRGLLHALRGFYTVRAQLEKARRVAEELVAEAERSGEPTQLVWANVALGETLSVVGETHAALAAFDRALNLTESDIGDVSANGQDARVTSHSFLAEIRWALGDPAGARQHARRAREIAERLESPFDKTRALIYSANLAYFQREPGRVLELSARVIAHSERHGLPFYLSLATVFQGWALVQQHQVERGLADIEEGMASYRATGARITVVQLLNMLADACLIATRYEQGRQAAQEACRLAAENGERQVEAESLRLRGELAARDGSEEEAAQLLRRSLELAEARQTKGWELRTAVSLARLLSRQGRESEVHELLAKRRAWFGPDVQAADLADADELLGA